MGIEKLTDAQLDNEQLDTISVHLMGAIKKLSFLRRNYSEVNELHDHLKAASVLVEAMLRELGL